MDEFSPNNKKTTKNISWPEKILVSEKQAVMSKRGKECPYLCIFSGSLNKNAN
jgi:hypothetical protein